MSTYLDYNASAALHPTARQAMLDVLDRPANAHSVHQSGQRAFEAVEQSRRQLADALGVRPERIVFTSGATEANALGLASVATKGPGWATSAVDHPSVRGWGSRTLPVDGQGRVCDFPEGDEGLAVMLANNETGVIQPVAEVIAIARRRGVPVHVDATQGPARMALPVALWSADTVALSAHKFGGPQGVGALIVAPGAHLEPLLRGGPQERGRRAGTLNVVGIVGMGAAAGTWDAWRGCLALRHRLEHAVVGLGGQVIGAGAERLGNTVCVRFEGRDAADLVMALDLQGIEVSAGSACASGATGQSHVLGAMGIQGSALRISTGWGTTADEVDGAVAALARILGAP
jgi:cysteine desulfurase